MPSYTLPKIKKSGASKPEPEIEYSYPDEYDRKVHIPANKDILGSLEIGKVVTVELTGKVTEVTQEERESGRGRQCFTIQVEKVEAPEDNEFEELAEER